MVGERRRRRSSAATVPGRRHPTYPDPMHPGEPSATARHVAAHRRTVERRPAPAGGRPEDDDRLAADVAADAPVDPGGPVARHLALRTAWFDHVLFAALDGGIGQVVVAAAGYDGRALRYDRPGVAWWELDHPDTQQDKRARLRRLGIDADHVGFVPADFRTDPVADRLLAAGLDAATPSMVLVEGVAADLDLPTLVGLLRALRQVAGAGSLLALSLATDSPDPEAAARRAAFARSVEALGQPARAVLTVDEADPLFATTGWQLIAEASSPPAGFALLEPAGT